MVEYGRKESFHTTCGWMEVSRVGITPMGFGRYMILKEMWSMRLLLNTGYLPMTLDGKKMNFLLYPLYALFSQKTCVVF